MTDGRRIAVLIGAASFVHLALAATTGLGDAEALYAAYARHLQGGYVDHPPAIGWLVAATGAGSAFAVRLPSMMLFVVSALLVAAIARRAGGSPRAAAIAVAIYVAVPELLASGAAASPDAPLAAAWLVCLYAMLRGWTVVAGLAAGAAMLSKYSGVWILPGIALWGLASGRRGRALVVIAVAVACFTPVLAWNARHGWVSALHRLVWTQFDAGVSLRNLGALVGGQIAYVSPVALVGLWWAARRGVARGVDGPIRFLAWTSVLALAMGYGLCLLSRVAEPHWPAPGYLGLVPVLGIELDRAWTPRVRRLVRIGAVWSAAVVVLLSCAIWTPLFVRVPGYDGRWDLTNDLRGWPTIGRAVRGLAPADVPVVASHYTTCAQIAFALGDQADRVFCLTREVDDFDLWGRGGLSPGAVAVVIGDPRFAAPTGREIERVEVPIRRGGRVVRRFAVSLRRLSSVARADAPRGRPDVQRAR